MNRRLRFAVPAGLIVLVGLPLAALAAQAGAQSNEVPVTAKKYQFNPSTVTVKQGDHVKLVITATDRDHGFKLDGYNIEQRLPKGVPTTVDFTADKAGTFVFRCSVVCGLGHGKMKGKLVVEPAGGAAPSNP